VSLAANGFTDSRPGHLVVCVWCCTPRTVHSPIPGGTTPPYYSAACVGAMVQLLEVSARRDTHRDTQRAVEDGSGTKPKGRHPILHVLIGLFSNPLVVAAVIGISLNIPLKQSIPKYVDQPLVLLGSAFTASALRESATITARTLFCYPECPVEAASEQSRLRSSLPSIFGEHGLAFLIVCNERWHGGRGVLQS